MATEESGFLSRWARRKALVREGRPPPEPAPAVAPEPLPAVGEMPVVAEPPAPPAQAEPAPPAPTLDDVALLTPGEDVARFVVQGVDPTVKNAALKKLFADPHYNVMDGLDTYIDDYGKPDPLPEGMLRQMVQSQFLGLFRDEDKPADVAEASAAAAPAPTEPKEPPDEDADLRLQPHDAADAGKPGAAAPGAGEDAGREP